MSIYDVELKTLFLSELNFMEFKKRTCKPRLSKQQVMLKYKVRPFYLSRMFQFFALRVSNISKSTIFWNLLNKKTKQKKKKQQKT